MSLNLHWGGCIFMHFIAFVSKSTLNSKIKKT